MSSYRGGCEVVDERAACSIGRFQCEIETDFEGALRESDASLLNVDIESLRRMSAPDAKLRIRLDNGLEAGFYLPVSHSSGEAVPIRLQSALTRPGD